MEAASFEEFDQYLIVEGAGGGEDLLKQAESFHRRWPESKLLPRIHEMRFFALQKMGRASEAKEAANEALRLVPENVTVRAALAIQLASEDGPLAERHARAVLDTLAAARVPRSVTPERYRQLAGRWRSQAHTALGLVRFREGRTDDALRELETAERVQPEFDAALALRLGRLYAALGRTAEARKRFEAAARSPDREVAALAEPELHRLSK